MALFLRGDNAGSDILNGEVCVRLRYSNGRVAGGGKWGVMGGSASLPRRARSGHEDMSRDR